MSKQASLSLDQAPPIWVPLQFFLTAPLFAFTAALLMLWQGPDIFSTRWNPALLGITHLLTLGYMGLIMMGAILQLLPVVAGTPMAYPVQNATIVHTSGTIGIVILCSGLMLSLPLAPGISMAMLGTAFLFFATLVVATLRNAPPQNITSQAIRLSVLMLTATVLLGLILLSNYVFGGWLQALEALTNLHLTFGLLGWVGILLVGVAYQVVPMFQLTPRYPAKLTRWLATILFMLLLGLAPASYSPALQMLLEVLLAAVFATFALVTLWLQSKRQRKLPDVTLNFWRGGMVSLLLAIAFWLAAQIFPALSVTESYSLLLGVLMIVGFAMSVINGMLYKIVPFLVWFHLQSRRGKNGPKIPNVREIMPESRTRRQMCLHFTALASLLTSTFLPATFIYPAAILFGGSNLWLWLNIVSATLTYRRIDALLRQM